MEQLEDEVFDLGEPAKGTLMPSIHAHNRQMPRVRVLKRFKYRLYDLEMDFCANQHGIRWMQ